MSAPKFTRLVRFTNPAGRVHYGEAHGKDLTLEGLVGQTVPVYQGGNPWDADFTRTSNTEEIAQVYLPTLLDFESNTLR